MHEFIYITIGVIAWEVEQQLTNPTTFNKRVALTVNSLLWCSLILVFDDEILSLFNVNQEPVWWIYILLGVIVDIIINRISK